MKQIFLPLILILVLFVACDNIPWPEEDRRLFVESCINGSPDSLKQDIDVRVYCECVQQKLEAEYTVQEIAEQEITMKEYLQMQMDCLEEQSPGQETN